MTTPIADRRTALLLAGGGLKGAVQIGYLREIINERRWPIGWVRGVSTGALQAVMIGHGPEHGLALLESLWYGLKEKSDLFDEPGTLKKIFSVLWGSSLLSNDPLRRKLEKYVQLETLLTSRIDTKVGVTNFNTKSFYEVGPEHFERGSEDFIKFVLASTAIPGEFEGMYYPGNGSPFPPGWYFDGGVVSMIPSIEGLIADGAERIIVCLCNPLEIDTDAGDYNKTIPTIKQALAISLHDNSVGDLLRMSREVEWINDQVRTGAVADKKLIDFIVIAPESPLPIGTLEVVPKKITQTVHLGQSLARKTFDAFYRKQG